MIRRITVPGSGTELNALESRGSDPHKLPILFIHENLGLVRYMIDVIERLSDAGHGVVAPDLLSRIGGTASFASAPTSVSTRQITEDVHEADLLSVYDSMSEGTDEIAVVGFCFGAEMGWRVITERTPQKAVLFYGIGPQREDTMRIRSQVHAVYAEHDARVNETLAPLGDVLIEGAADLTLESFPGTAHAFHDHTRPDRYHPVAARAAWRHTLDFLADQP